MSSPAAPQHDPKLSSASVAVCGAGIAGYLTAIVLHRCGFSRITLIDRLSDPAHFHRTRAYTLAIYQLGQRLLRDLPDLFHLFKRISFEQTVRHVTTCTPDARLSHSATSLPAAPVHWLLRADFVKLLADYVAEHCPGVTLLTDTAVDDFVFDDDTLRALRLRSADNALVELPVDLVVACDGSHSSVQRIARAHQSRIHSARGFDLCRRSSPSVGMCPKGILLSATPQLTRPDHSSAAKLVDPTHVYKLVGDPSYEHRFDLLLLPVGNPDVQRVRIAMLCLPPDHELWHTYSVHDAFHVFERSFPRLNVRDIISPAEMARLIEEKPMPFCHIQRPDSLVGLFKHADPAAPSKGIVFLGDSAHAFPPDLAQGINSALEDVRVFHDVVREFGSDRRSLRAVLRNYELRREPEVRHLLRLMRNGAAYQYGQNSLASLAYSLHARLRSVLQRLAPRRFHPVVDTLIRQNYDYSEVSSMERESAINTALLLISALVVPVCGVLLYHGSPFATPW